MEDYEAGRKTGAAGSTGFSGLPTSTSTGGLFGNTSTSGFGTSSSLIGQKPTTGFGTTGEEINLLYHDSNLPRIEPARYYRVEMLLTLYKYIMFYM